MFEAGSRTSLEGDAVGSTPQPAPEGGWRPLPLPASSERSFVMAL